MHNFCLADGEAPLCHCGEKESFEAADSQAAQGIRSQRWARKSVVCCGLRAFCDFGALGGICFGFAPLVPPIAAKERESLSGIGQENLSFALEEAEERRCFPKGGFILFLLRQTPR